MVIHLAALAGVRPSIERPLEYEEVNVRGTMNLWELCKDFHIKNSFVHLHQVFMETMRKFPLRKQIM